MSSEPNDVPERNPPPFGWFTLVLVSLTVLAAWLTRVVRG